MLGLRLPTLASMSKSKRPSPSGKVPPRGAKKGSSNRPSVPPRGTRPATATPTTKAGAGGAGGSGGGGGATTGGGQGPAWERRRKQRRQRNLATVSAAVVVGLVVILLVVKAVSGSGSASASPLPKGIQAQLQGVTVADMVSAATNAPSGAVTGLPSAIDKAPPLAPGKPEVLYVGAEYCPYCAAERWPLTMALSKFGQFANLGSTTSSSSDANANTPTMSFHGSTFTSPYLSFVAVEQQDRKGGTLQKLTSAQAKIVAKYDNTPYVSQQAAGSIPFIDFNGRFVASGASFDGSQLSNLDIQRASAILTAPVTTAQAGAASKQASTAMAAQAVAGHLIGVLCAVTGDQPASVCSQVPAALKQGGAPASGKTSR